MSHFYDGARLTLALGLCILIGVVFGVTYRTLGTANRLLAETTETIIEARTSIAHTNDLLAESQKSIQALREHADRDLIVIGAAATTVEKASRAQQSYWDNYGAQVAHTIDSVNALVADTNESLNRKVLPATVSAIEDTRQIALAAAKSIDDTNAGLRPVLENAALLSGNAAKVLGDPAITASLAHIEASTRNTEEGTAIVVAVEKKALAPASFLKRAIGETVHLVGRFLGF